MTIKLTMQEALNINSVYHLLSKLPFKVAYRLGRIKDLIQPDIKEFGTQRDVLFTDLALVKEKNQWIIPEEKKEEVDAALKDPLAIIVEVPLDPVPLSWLRETDEIAPDIMVLMQKLFTDSNEIPKV